MTRPGASLLLLILFASALAAAAPQSVDARFWQPVGAALGEYTRAAFTGAMAARGVPVKALPAISSTAATATPTAAARLEMAIAEYRGFRYAVALDGLGVLAREVEASGGGELDSRQLATLYLYRGLARYELAQSGPAWDDFVRAAQIDPGQVLDPAQFPPRMIASWRRAVAELAVVRRIELEVVAPAAAITRVDGRVVVGKIAVTPGSHLVRVEAAGFEPWAIAFTASSAQEQIAPAMRPEEPPDSAAMAKWSKDDGAARRVVGALARGLTGWRFVARRLDPDSGATAAEEAPIDDASVDRVVRAVLVRLLDGPAPVAAAPDVRRASKWWPWMVVAGVATALTVAIPVAIVYSPAATGTVGGNIGALR